MTVDELDLLGRLKDAPPLRPEAYERARRTLRETMAASAQARQTPPEPEAAPVRHERFTRARDRRLGLRVKVGIVAGLGMLAAATAIVPQLVSGRPSTEISIAAPPVVTNPSTGSPASVPKAANAKAVLLAAAKVSSKEPLPARAYWYSRVRRLDLVPEFRGQAEQWDSEVQAAVREFEDKRQDPNATAAEIATARARFEAKVRKVKSESYLYSAVKEQTVEEWRPLGDGNDLRVFNQDFKFYFASADDKARWQRRGSPKLYGSDQPQREEEKPAGGPEAWWNPSLTWSDYPKLPTDKEKLKAELMSMYEQSDLQKDGRDLRWYMWHTGVQLLTSPITPGTRAALYQVLADSDLGLKSQSNVVDAMGRTGTSLETQGHVLDSLKGGKVTHRLILDADTGKVLQLETLEEGLPLPTQRQTFVTTGYVDKQGNLPQ